MHHVGLGPDVYATFENGMAYKYIPGETLTTTTVRDPSVYKLVAKTMARFHQLDGSTIGDRTNESGMWSKMEQFASLVPERFSSPSTDHQLVLINYSAYIVFYKYKYYLLPTPNLPILL